MARRCLWEGRGLAVGSGGVCQRAQRGRGEPWWASDLGPVDKGNGLVPGATTRLGPGLAAGLPCGLETLTWTKKCLVQVPLFWVFFQMPTYVLTTFDALSGTFWIRCSQSPISVFALDAVTD